MILRSHMLPHGKISYYEEGSGKDLLFLHGAFVTSKAYTPLISLLAQNYHVIAPTHPGHGESFVIDKTWAFHDYITIYRNFLDAITFKPSVIVGHSFGGAIALGLGDEFPNAHIVGIDAAGLPFPLDIKDFLKALIEEGEEAIRVHPDKSVLKELRFAAEALAESLTKHPENISWFYRHGPALDLTDYLQKLHNSVSLFWGIQDRIVPVSVGRRMKDIIPQATLTEFADLEHNYSVIDPDFAYARILEAVRTREHFAAIENKRGS